MIKSCLKIIIVLVCVFMFAFVSIPRPVLGITAVGEDGEYTSPETEKIVSELAELFDTWMEHPYTDSEHVHCNKNSKYKDYKYYFTLNEIYSSGWGFDNLFKNILMSAQKKYARSNDYLYDNILQNYIVAPRYNTNGAVIGVTYYFNIKYRMTHSDLLAIDAEATRIVKSFNFNSSTSKYDKLKRIYSWFVENCTYCKGHKNHEENNRYYSCYTVYGALFGTNRSGNNDGTNHEACCQGFAHAYQLLCKKAGITVYVAIGQTTDGPHYWNMVYLDSSKGTGYYFIDVTYDIVKKCANDPDRVCKGFLKGSSGIQTNLFSISDYVNGKQIDLKYSAQTGTKMFRLNEIDLSKYPTVDFVTPVTVHIQRVNLTSTEVSWISGCSNASKIEVLFSETGKDGSWVTKGTYTNNKSGSQTKRVLTGLIPGKRYYVKVVSINGNQKVETQKLSFIA